MTCLRVTLVCVGASLLAACGADSANQFPEVDNSIDYSDTSIEGQIAAYAATLRPSLPMQSDEISTMTGVRGEGRELIYEFTISENPPTNDSALLSQVAQEEDQAYFCQTGDRRLIAQGATVRTDYRAPNGVTWQTRVTACP